MPLKLDKKKKEAAKLAKEITEKLAEVRALGIKMDELILVDPEEIDRPEEAVEVDALIDRVGYDVGFMMATYGADALSSLQYLGEAEGFEGFEEAGQAAKQALKELSDIYGWDVEED